MSPTPAVGADLTEDLPMRTPQLDNRINRDSAGTARASYANVCAMPAASWSFPTILVATGHKPEPRRHPVTPL